jgi:hypothetical protein
MRVFRSFATALLLACSLAAQGEETDPAAKWLTVYGWIQTAERLATAEQWPLALGSYLEADRQVKALAEAHPDFEPEMVNYRRGALAKTIAETEARLTTDEHEVMMKYLDFIESLELGEAQRYANEYEAAFGTLGMAKAVLDEIIEKKPEGFREAVASQYARLESSLTWLDSQINFTAVSRPGVVLDESIDWGTTRFVRASDLPSSRESAALTSDLFPGGLAPEADPAAPHAAESTPATPRRAEKDSGPVRFRMSTRQTSAPDPRESAPGASPPP